LAGRNPLDPSDDVVGAPLVVTTSIDDLDGPQSMTDVSQAGGAADLSLREAILIANNHGGADTITFDPSIFPPDAPVAIDVDINGGLGALSVVSGAGTTIDATGAGVVLEGGGVVRGVTFGLQLHAPDQKVIGLNVHEFTAAAGEGWKGICVSGLGAERLVLDRLLVSCLGDDSTSPQTIRLEQSNHAAVVDCQVTANRSYAIAGVGVLSSGDVLVQGNRINGGRSTVYLGITTGVSIRGNDLRSSVSGAAVMIYNSSAAEIFGNVIEDNAGDGIEVYDACDSITVHNNLITLNVRNGVWSLSPLTVLSNQITTNGGLGIQYSSIRASPPVVTGFDGTTVVGTTDLPDGSTVEVFVDPDEEGALLVGTDSASGGTFAVAVTLPNSLPGRHLTATVTTPTDPRTTSPFSVPFSF
jgi:parallel beta-helix repeat protein